MRSLIGSARAARPPRAASRLGMGRSAARATSPGVLVLTTLAAMGFAGPLMAQDAPRPSSPPGAPSPARETLTFLAGGVAGLLVHESGHLLFNGLFDGQPRLKRVRFGGVPFFAITHRDDLSPRREYAVSSAGFWVQHLSSEWILTARPHLRHERARLLQGMLAFDVLASVAYSGAAFARAGPPERDTRSMAASRRLSERWIGALVLAPALLDGYRFFRPDTGWARWSSRAAKAGLVLLVLKGTARRPATGGARPPQTPAVSVG